MYGDIGVLRQRAAQLREQGHDLRRHADQLSTQMAAVDWAGRAAEAMRARVRERAAQLHDLAGRHETAAGSLERHARQVETLKEQIAAAQRRARVLMGDGDPRLATFLPPPPGHRDWLGVDLPER